MTNSVIFGSLYILKILYEYVAVIRGTTTSIDSMTSDLARIRCDVLEKFSVHIVKSKHVNRVLSDINTKPPATIE
ncbi:hypothetical protein [Lysinibacillus sp. PWR01]|uniref:GMP synthase (glutamine-hydrolyzing) n=1 Tax=Lysinibacillus sp. PWR01 TaxID=3342384 RepID=UPI00372D2BC7